MIKLASKEEKTDSNEDCTHDWQPFGNNYHRSSHGDIEIDLRCSICRKKATATYEFAELGAYECATQKCWDCEKEIPRGEQKICCACSDARDRLVDKTKQMIINSRKSGRPDEEILKDVRLALGVRDTIRPTAYHKNLPKSIAW